MILPDKASQCSSQDPQIFNLYSLVLKKAKLGSYVYIAGIQYMQGGKVHRQKYGAYEV